MGRENWLLPFGSRNYIPFQPSPKRKSIARRGGVFWARSKGPHYHGLVIRPIALALIALAGAPATAAEAVTAKVLSCYDGDTCQLEREILPGRDRVRL